MRTALNDTDILLEKLPEKFIDESKYNKKLIKNHYQKHIVNTVDIYLHLKLIIIYEFLISKAYSFSPSR